MGGRNIIRFENIENKDNFIKESSMVNTKGWLGYLCKCPGIKEATSMGYLYILNQDIEFTYKDGIYGARYQTGGAEDIISVKSFSEHVTLPKLTGQTDYFRVLENQKNEGDTLFNFFDKNSIDAIYKFQLGLKVVTPPGISLLLVEPFYRRNMNYSITPGLLNTDNYEKDGRMESVNLLNFFLTWDRDHEDELIIPARTPLAQIIPYKRK